MSKLKKLGFTLAMIIVASGCRKKEEPIQQPEKEVIEVEKPKPIKKEISIKPASFGSKLVLDNMDVSDNITFNIDEVKNYSQIEQGNFDIAIVPAYLGPYFYNQTNQGIEVAAITMTGNVYMVNDKQINNQMDYRGKNLLVPDLAGNLSKIVDSKVGALNLIMRLNIEYYNSMQAIVDKMDTTNNYVTILSEPYYTRALRDKTLYVSNIQDLLPIGDGEFSSEIIIVNKKYLKDNKEDFDKFLAEYKKATSLINNSNEVKNDDKKVKISDKLLKTYDISEEEAKKSIERLDFTYIDGDTMKGSYQVFMDRLAQIDDSILGKTKPSDDFFYDGESELN